MPESEKRYCKWCKADVAANAGPCPRSFECPTCHAKPGQKCKRPSGHEAAEMHVARLDLEFEAPPLITAAKLRGLRQVLERDHVVRFKNGSQVEYEDCPRCRGDGRVEKAGRLPHEAIEWLDCPRCGGEKVLLRVTGPMGGVSRFRLDEDAEVTRAYVMALEGPPPKKQPPGDPADFGDCPF